MSQISNIWNGWKNYLSGFTTEQERARAKACNRCFINGSPGAVVGTFEKLMPDYSLKEIQGLKCSVCKCALSAKIRSKNEKCPLNKWPEN